MKARNDMVEFAGNKASQKASPSVIASLFCFVFIKAAK